MIQRIQTIYLLVAVVLSVICMFMPLGEFSIDGLAVAREYNLWLLNIDDNASGHHFTFVTSPMFAVLLLSSALACYAIFAFRNRVAQARFCQFSVLLIVGWYILYAVYGHILGDTDGRTSDFAPSWAAVLPAMSLVFLLLARRAIMADERLVRAADRIR